MTLQREMCVSLIILGEFFFCAPRLKRVWQRNRPRGAAGRGVCGRPRRQQLRRCQRLHEHHDAIRRLALPQERNLQIHMPRQTQKVRPLSSLRPPAPCMLSSTLVLFTHLRNGVTGNRPDVDQNRIRHAGTRPVVRSNVGLDRGRVRGGGTSPTVNTAAAAVESAGSMAAPSAVRPSPPLSTYRLTTASAPASTSAHQAPASHGFISLTVWAPLSREIAATCAAMEAGGSSKRLMACHAYSSSSTPYR